MSGITRDVKDKLFLEAENGCAVCGMRNVRALTIHHIVSNGMKNNDYDNLILLCSNCHVMHHQRKGLSKAELVDIKRRLILKTLTPFGINALRIAYRNEFVVGAPFTLLHLVGLGFLKKGEVISYVGSGDDDHEWGSGVEMDVTYEITNKGKKLYEKWKLKN